MLEDTYTFIVVLNIVTEKLGLLKYRDASKFVCKNKNHIIMQNE